MTLIHALAETAAAEEEAVDGLVGVVVELLRDKDKDIRALALEQVRTEAKGAAATKVFAAELAKLPAESQVGLLRALADRGDNAARAAVLELLASSKEEPVRIAVIEALGVLGEPADLEILVKSLESKAAAEQAAARSSLIRLRGENVPTLIAAALKPAKSPVRVMLIEILAERRGIPAIPELLAFVTDQEATVRAAAMAALGQLASPEHLPGMLPGVLAAEAGREREAAEKCVALVCGRIAAPNERAEPVIQAMSKFSGAEQTALLSTLGRIGGTSALAPILKIIAEQDSVLHEAGVRALCNWPDATVAPRLLELASTDKQEALRIAALRALIRVAPLADMRTDAERLALLAKAMSMATRDEERLLVLDRARIIRTLAALQFIVPYLDQPAFAEQACLSVVELAHHRTLRQPNKAEFDKVLDKVIATSKDPVVIDRANRYKKDQTWVRPAKSKS